MENQAVALAEAVGLPYVIKRVQPRPPWTWLPPGWWPWPLAALGGGGQKEIAAPWPDLLISCGRRAVPYALLVKRESAGASTIVHIQNPQTRISAFDLVAPPRHDHLQGPNVIETAASLHRITAERLAAAAEIFAPSLAHLPRPLVAVLIGGSNSCYRLTPEIITNLANQLRALCQDHGVGLAVTPSRRTGDDNIKTLRRALEGLPAVVWDFQGDNPYFGYLGLADQIIVTCDSVNMVSEACATGKPVQVVHLPGGNRKFNEFHDAMRAAGYTRPFQGVLEQWRYEPANDAAMVAERIHELLASKGIVAG
jgi:mitochondrial fission protein ELM1